MKLTKKQMARIAKIATKSGITTDRWLSAVVDCALANDEAHFAEMADRDAAEKAVDRLQFSKLSLHLSNLPGGVIDQLVRVVASARLQGRAEAARVSR